MRCLHRGTVDPIAKIILDFVINIHPKSSFLPISIISQIAESEYFYPWDYPAVYGLIIEAFIVLRIIFLLHLK